MKQMVTIIIIGMVAFGFLNAKTMTGSCVGVYDGDTINVFVKGKTIRIRMEGVDCPELNQAYGSEAKKFTSKLTQGKTVKVKIKGYDHKKNIIGRVFVGKLDISHQLIRAGLGWHYKKYNKEFMLATAEKKARSHQIYIWSQSKPQPPWEYRKLLKQKGDETVYITCDGTHYHKGSCKHLKNSKIFLKIGEAHARGYTPCPRCKPKK